MVLLDDSSNLGQQEMQVEYHLQMQTESLQQQRSLYPKFFWARLHESLFYSTPLKVNSLLT